MSLTPKPTYLSTYVDYNSKTRVDFRPFVSFVIFLSILRVLR